MYARACEDANLMQSGKRGRDPGWPVEGDHYEHQDDHFDNCDGDDYGHQRDHFDYCDGDHCTNIMIIILIIVMMITVTDHPGP